MKQKMPQSPFSTRLSGSAKETELRLRNIFQWKKKRPPVLLVLLSALAVLLCCGLISCRVQTEMPALDDPVSEKTPPVAAAEPEDLDTSDTDDTAVVLTAMAAVAAEDFTNPEYFGNVTAEELAAALNAAVDQQISEADFLAVLGSNVFPHWYIEDAWLEGGSGGHSGDDLHFAIRCGLPDNIVEVSLIGDGYHTAYFEDETLYQMIRHKDDFEEIIDPEAYEQFRNLLIPQMESTLSTMGDNPGNFTGYEVTRFTPAWSYEDTRDGSQVVLYHFSYALLTDTPEKVGWAGGMALDSKLRVVGVNGPGQLAVKYRGDETVCTAFMGSDFYFDPNDPDRADWAMQRINDALDYAENKVAERTGQTRVFTADTVMTNCYSYTYSDPEDYSTYDWFRLDSTRELKKGDLLLVLEESDGMSRVVIPYGDIPGCYGFVDSSLLSADQVLITQGNQAILTAAAGYSSPGGSIWTTSMSGTVRILATQGSWVQVQPHAGGEDPCWVENPVFTYDFNFSVIDAPKTLPLTDFP